MSIIILLPKINSLLFEIHTNLTHGPKYLPESDDMSIECFPGIEDFELDSDFTIRTIPLEFEVKKETLNSTFENCLLLAAYYF